MNLFLLRQMPGSFCINDRRSTAPNDTARTYVKALSGRWHTLWCYYSRTRCFLNACSRCIAHRSSGTDPREDAGRTGIYLLLGPDPNLPGRQLVYVGEGDQVKTRLVYHDADESKDFFTRAVLIVSKDDNLTKAHGRYLESRIIAAIGDAGRAKLHNGTEPPFRGLPEPEIADMERVLDEIEVLLPVLGFDVLRPAGYEAEVRPNEETIITAMESTPTFTADI